MGGVNPDAAGVKRPRRDFASAVGSPGGSSRSDAVFMAPSLGGPQRGDGDVERLLPADEVSKSSSSAGVSGVPPVVPASASPTVSAHLDDAAASFASPVVPDDGVRDSVGQKCACDGTSPHCKFGQMVLGSGGHAGRKCGNRVSMKGDWCGKCNGRCHGGQRGGAVGCVADIASASDAVLNRGAAWESLPQHLRMDRGVVLRVVGARGGALASVPIEFRDDVEVVLAAVRSDDFAWASVSERLRLDPRVVEE
eukprot:6984474-Pyramimonas_sp.AAC.1